MIAFNIEVNGKSLGSAGTDDLSVLTTIVSAVGKLGRESQGAPGPERSHQVELTVGGLTARAVPGENEHLDWIKETLKPGDVVTVRIVEAASADPPKTAQPVQNEETYKQQFEWAKSFYFDNRDRFERG
jgi:hypothetical protein